MGMHLDSPDFAANPSIYVSNSNKYSVTTKNTLHLYHCQKSTEGWIIATFCCMHSEHNGATFETVAHILAATYKLINI